MRKSACFIAVTGMIAISGVFGDPIGLIDSAEAGGHNYSLAGRSFRVEVEDLFDGSTVTNCYTFEEDGTWIDPRFLGDALGIPLDVFPGMWVQHSSGFVTRYTAFAKSPENADFGIPPLRLIQNGTVVKKSRRGRMKLRAYSTVMIDLPGEDIVIGNFVSKGYSVQSCD